MSRSFLADYSENMHFLTKWVEGEPVNVTLLGITGVNIEVTGRKQFSVRSLRCEHCGFLESYAV